VKKPGFFRKTGFLSRKRSNITPETKQMPHKESHETIDQIFPGRDLDVVLEDE